MGISVAVRSPVEGRAPMSHWGDFQQFHVDSTRFISRFFNDLVVSAIFFGGGVRSIWNNFYLGGGVLEEGDSARIPHLTLLNDNPIHFTAAFN